MYVYTKQNRKKKYECEMYLCKHKVGVLEWEWNFFCFSFKVNSQIQIQPYINAEMNLAFAILNTILNLNYIIMLLFPQLNLLFEKFTDVQK